MLFSSHNRLLVAYIIFILGLQLFHLIVSMSTFPQTKMHHDNSSNNITLLLLLLLLYNETNVLKMLLYIRDPLGPVVSNKTNK